MSAGLATDFIERVVTLRPALCRQATYWIGTRGQFGSPDDFVQDTIVTALRSADRFEDDNLSGWLFAILRGHIRNARRRAAIRACVPLSPPCSENNERSRPAASRFTNPTCSRPASQSRLPIACRHLWMASSPDSGCDDASPSPGPRNPTQVDNAPGPIAHLQARHRSGAERRSTAVELARARFRRRVSRLILVPIGRYEDWRMSF
ncbi:RNA polymerase sigma factor [Rhodopseudomonas sp.]|uniref:RNA polymerase sigma factor n=1 Tax=Rhodopseudomonas sp. TaxID=1078 RepID=UPI003B3B9F04